MKNSGLSLRWVLCAGCLASLFLVCIISYGQTTISIVGTWSDTQDADDLQAGAGSDLAPTSESAANVLSVTITAPGSWRVDVRRDNGSWHGDLHLWCQRAAGGTGSVSGGMAYQEITTADLEFFTGSGDAAGIPIQLRITGISIQIPTGIYSAIMTYTLTDTL